MSGGITCKRRRLGFVDAPTSPGLPLLSWWCGYVTLPLGHRWEATKLLEREAVVHGGITYRQRMASGEVVVGFDMMHFGDTQAGTSTDEAYCIAQVESLARQVIEAATPSQSRSE